MKIPSHIIDHLKLLRPQDSLDIILVLALGVLATFPDLFPWREFISLSAGLVFMLFFVHISNYIADVEVDRINVPDRPLPSGRVSIPAAKGLAWIYLGASFLMFLSVGPSYVAVFFVLALVGWLYSGRNVELSHRHFWGTLIIVFFYAVAPFMIGAYLSGGSFQLTLTETILLFALMLSTFSRVLLKDYRDKVGDRLSGKITPLVRIGASRLRIVILSSATFSVVLFCILPLWWTVGIATKIFSGSILVLLGLLFFFATKTGGQNLSTAKLGGYSQPRVVQLLYYVQRVWLVLLLLMYSRVIS